MSVTKHSVNLKMICVLGALLIAGCGSTLKPVVIAQPCKFPDKPAVPASLVEPVKYDFPQMLNDVFRKSDS